jgi:hypothetical protein
VHDLELIPVVPTNDGDMERVRRVQRRGIDPDPALRSVELDTLQALHQRIGLERPRALRPQREHVDGVVEPLAERVDVLGRAPSQVGLEELLVRRVVQRHEVRRRGHDARRRFRIERLNDRL